MRPIEAQATVVAPVDEVWGLLADLREHWLLADRWTEVLRVDGDGGTIRLRGPLGMRREVRVRVTTRLPARELQGVAQLGTRTAASVRWELAAQGTRATCVTLSAAVLSASAADRLLLALGARRWLRWRFAVTLCRLNDRLGASASQTLFDTSAHGTL